jgi:peptidoglycan/LPS O-acetylase OafA/YrhL
MANTDNKVAYLDGIRGVAALLVFFHHFLLAFYSGYYSFNAGATHLHGLDIAYGQSVFSVLSNGHFCVCVFFVLSGLVLSRKYFLTNKFEIIVSGAQRRFLRLYIPVASVIIIAYLLMQAGLFYNVAASKITHSEWWLGSLWTFPDVTQKLLYSLTVGTMFRGDATFDTSLWTMSIEFMGSLLVFAFLALTHNTRNRPACLFLVFCYFVFADDPFMAAFLFGISLNYVSATSGWWNKYCKAVLVILLLFTGLFLGSYPTAGDVRNTTFAYFPRWLMDHHNWFHVIGGYFLVLSFVLSPALQRVISRRPFRFLGYISFSFYLLHPLVIGSFACYLCLQLYQPLGYNAAVLVVFISTVCVCIFLSWLMTRYIDDPGIRLSKYVYNKWVKKFVSQTASVTTE